MLYFGLYDEVSVATKGIMLDKWSESSFTLLCRDYDLVFFVFSITLYVLDEGMDYFKDNFFRFNAIPSLSKFVTCRAWSKHDFLQIVHFFVIREPC